MGYSSRFHSAIRDLLNVMASNIIILISGIVNGFVLPYVLNVSGYGHYRIFILYSSYMALLHCGFVDGVLLKYGGINKNKLNKKKFRTFTKSFMIFQLIISIILVFVAILINNKFYTILFMSLGFYTFIFNTLTYYIYVLQSTMQFKSMSIRNAAQSVLSIIFTLLICIVYKIGLVKINYIFFIISFILTYLIVLIWCITSYKDITFGSSYSLLHGFHYIFMLCKIGIYLTISSQVSNLIMVIDNQFVSLLFKSSIYGVYSFSYGMSSRALVILSAVATVLLPHLKRDTFTHIIQVYPNILSCMMLIIYLSLAMYFPLTILVKMIFPNYINSLIYLRVFLPELGVVCCTTLIIFNYYNALHKSKFFFYISLIMLIFSVIADMLMYLSFHTPLSISIGSFISLIIWYLVSEHFLVKWYHVKWCRNLVYMILMIVVFIFSTMFINGFYGFLCYLILYIVISIIMFKRIIKFMLNKMINKIY